MSSRKTTMAIPAVTSSAKRKRAFFECGSRACRVLRSFINNLVCHRSNRNFLLH